MQTTIATLEEEDCRNRDINSFFYERLKHRTISPEDESQLEGDICSICHERFAAGNDMGTVTVCIISMLTALGFGFDRRIYALCAKGRPYEILKEEDDQHGSALNQDKEVLGSAIRS
ncbi:hypothetical protein Droror1_Dr00007433 [Drosera rotundifolia]